MRHLFTIVLTVLLGAALCPEASANAPLQCAAAFPVPPVVGAEGTRELVGKVVITCTGGIAGDITQTDIRVSLNTNITNRAENAALFNPFVDVGEWATVEGNTDTSNEVVFRDVPIDNPGPDGVRLVFIENVFADASLLFSQFPGVNPAIIESISSSMVPILNGEVPVAVVIQTDSGCESPLSASPGKPPFLLARNVMAGSGVYRVLLSPVVLAGDVVGLTVTAAELAFPSSCTSPSAMTPQGRLSIHSIVYDNSLFWLESSYTPAGSDAFFSLDAYGPGAVPAD